MSKLKINGHGHILPEPSEIPKFMKDKKLFWIDDDKILIDVDVDKENVRHILEKLDNELQP